MISRASRVCSTDPSHSRCKHNQSVLCIDCRDDDGDGDDDDDVLSAIPSSVSSTTTRTPTPSSLHVLSSTPEHACIPPIHSFVRRGQTIAASTTRSINKTVGRLHPLLASRRKNNTTSVPRAPRNTTMRSTMRSSEWCMPGTCGSPLAPLHHSASPSPLSAPPASLSPSSPPATIDTPATLSPSLASSPTCWSQLSRRHSKFTAFSGSSSSSSIYSADSVSLRHSNHHCHHWTLGEKPDISTVFEEDSQADYDIDLAAGHREQSQGIPSHPTSFSHSRPKDLDHPPPPPPPSSRFRKLPNQASYSSLASATSAKSTGRPVHPFASALVRPTSPPPVPSPGYKPAKTALSGSKSLSNLAETYRMQSQVAPVHHVTLSSADHDDVDECPVCLEGLDSSFSLPGEKGFIIAECGHAVHQACFVLCYGDIPPVGSRKYIGLCGICRQPMRVAEIAGVKKHKANKLASLTGQNSTAGVRNGLKSPSIGSIHSAPSKSMSSQHGNDTTGDDPLDTSATYMARPLDDNGEPKVIVPSVSIKSEYPTISKSKAPGKAQIMTAMISITVPAALDRPKYPARPRPRDAECGGGGAITSPRLPPSPRSTESRVDGSGAARSASPLNVTDPFAHAVADLRNRLLELNKARLDTVGTLRLFDLLTLRGHEGTQEFYMYLFQNAILCVSEEKKSSFKSFFSSATSSRFDHSGASNSRMALSLKGRIHFRHVERVVDTSIPGEHCLTIYMNVKNLTNCVIVFRDRGSLETWKRTLLCLLDEFNEQAQTQQQLDSSKKITKLMGQGAPTPISVSGSHSAKSFAAPLTAASCGGDAMFSPCLAGQAAMTPGTSAYASSSPPASHQATAGDLAHVAPLAPVHTPLDLVIVLSLPASNVAQGGNLALKTRLMRQSLAFVLATMGPRDRISLVACEMGTNGTVRKTPFLNTTRYDSRLRLEAFVELLGTGHQDDDEFEWPVGPDEKMDVVTAMNVALDIVLQRKAKNPLGGMILISDTADSIKRAQMDLVTARLDAANLPVHSIGYGKGHDPSPLWMISNHTFGTYTFVKEWYDLQSTIAGVVGGMMSIAMTKVKVHLSCQEEFKTLKTAGSSHSLISRNGKEVDLDLHELRFGETREILVELDLEASAASNNDNDEAQVQSQSQSQTQSQLYSGGSSGSERANSRLGISSPASLNGEGTATSEGGGFSAVYEDGMIDEWPVTQVDCSWTDPSSDGRVAARLSYPVLLTVAILPPRAPPPTTPSDPTLVRRRMEVLASDMITRALLIATRKNYAQAAKILSETRRIVDKVGKGMSAQVTGRDHPTRRDGQIMLAIQGLGRVSADLEMLMEGLEENADMFDRDHRNFAAQQAVVLRLQKSWTTRTLSEAAYCTQGSLDIARASAEWSLAS